jgi:hypothetical protein
MLEKQVNYLEQMNIICLAPLYHLIRPDTALHFPDMRFAQKKHA